MNLALLRYSFFTLFCLVLYVAPAQQCVFRIDMHDDFGDGWDGGVLTLSSGAANYTLYLDSDASDSTFFFPANTGSTIQLSWAPPVLYNDEVSFSLFNNDGDLLFTMSNPTAGSVYTAAASCITCLKAANLLVENVYDTRAKLRWSPATASGTPIGYWVIYGPKGFTPAPNLGDSVYVSTPKVTLTGLTPYTRYDFYVQQDCGNGDTGDVTGPLSFQTYRSDDVGITAVLSPENGCQLGTEIVRIRMTNFGANAQSLIPFNYSVNGVPAGIIQPLDGFYTGVLGKDSSAVIEFDKTSNFSAPGEYLIKVWTEMKGDNEPANDTFYYRVVNRLLAPYRQDFETWNGGWAVDTASLNSSWAFGHPSAPVINGAASGQNAWVTNLTGLHNAKEQSYLGSPCFDFSALTADPVIECSLHYATETTFDGAYLEMSLDDGASWQKVGAIGEGINWYNFYNEKTALGDVWDGSSNGWVFARHSLPGAAGHSPVRLRFAFSGDEIEHKEGMGIDDIALYEPFTDDLAGLSANTDGKDGACGLETDLVHFRFANFGTQPKTLFNLAYSVNGAAPVVENIGAVTVAPDEIFNYTFSMPFDSRDGVFEIRCWPELSGELNTANDTAVFVVDHLPAPIPFQEDFEGGLPSGWTSNGTVSADHNNVSQVLAFHMSGAAFSYKTELPNVGFVHIGDSLTFDYRITSFSSNGTIPTTLGGTTRFEVQISTDCGDTYQTVYTIDQNSHTPSAGLQTVGVGLSDYPGKSIRIRIVGFWSAGNFYFDLDNINLRSCPAKMNLSADISPAAPGQNNGSASVQVGIGNPPYRFEWNTGDSTQTVAQLPAGTFTVTVIDAFGCSDVLIFQILSVSAAEITGLKQLSLRPNPTAGQATLQVALDHPASMQLQLLDLMGRVLWQAERQDTDTLLETIDLSAYPEGLYLLRLQAEGQALVRKLVKN
ncbi:MAG: T9SS type A sorting domain-containing protein [Saprospiraceae bacterium]|nr:T9SS type A sorting domain-containing protein [Saprospiraceae bacterium]